MANKYPDAQVIAFDMVPSKIRRKSVPTNFRFELRDANLPMDHWNNSFDFVQVRAAQEGIAEFELFLYKMARILRPGGVLLLGGGDTQFYDEDSNPLGGDENGPRFTWIQKLFSKIIPIFQAKSPTRDAREQWEGWLKRNPNFELVETWNMKTAVGPWQTDMTLAVHRASTLLRENMILLSESFTPLMLDAGHSVEEVERIKKEMRRELMEEKPHVFANWVWTICRKKGDIDVEGTWIPPPPSDRPPPTESPAK